MNYLLFPQLEQKLDAAGLTLPQEQVQFARGAGEPQLEQNLSAGTTSPQQSFASLLISHLEHLIK